MLRILAALFLCLAFAPIARAQTLDCASATGLMQRVCESPDLVAMEEERRNLIGELQFIDPAHPAIQAESGFMASQDACADAACLAAGYAEHNQTLRTALEAMQTPEPELVEAPEERAPPVIEPRERDDARGARLDDGPAAQLTDYLSTIIAWLVTLGIALWLVSASGRARRADRGE